MEKVITINLNGNAYQFDEGAYNTLRAYLDRAQRQLEDNPDRVEIMADLEQAIAEKCQKFLGPNKTVVAASETDQIVAEMGPVESTDDPNAHAAAGADGTKPGETAAPRPSKRFYRVREGAMFAGVCTGIAAYLGIDVTIVRIIVAVLAFVTNGWAVFGYWMIAMIAPEAQTADQRAAAHGQLPFNAQQIIDHAKRAAADFKDGADRSRHEWKRQWRAQQRQWRAQHRAWRRQWREKGGDPRSWGPWGPVPAAAYPPPAWAVFATPVFSILGVTCFALLAASIVSLVNTGAIYGWPLPPEIPMWAGILILIMLFQVVTAPIRAARRASYYVRGGPHAWFAVWDGLFATAATILVVWLLYRHMAPVHSLREFMQNLPEAFRALAQDVKMWIQLLIEELK